jgi:hypothetical protein
LPYKLQPGDQLRADLRADRITNYLDALGGKARAFDAIAARAASWCARRAIRNPAVALDVYAYIGR